MMVALLHIPRGHFSCKLVISGLLMALVSCSGLADSSGKDAEIFQWLETANDLRVSDPAAFNAQLEKIRPYRDQLNAAQLRRLQYLEAYQHAFNGRPQTALEILRELFQSSEQPLERVEIGQTMANVFALTGVGQDAFAVLEDILPEVPRIADSELKIRTWMVAEMLYMQIAEFGMAEQMDNQIAAENPTGRLQCLAIQHRIDLYLRTNRLLENLALYDQVQQACDPDSPFQALALTYATVAVARAQMESGALDRARQMLLAEAERVQQGQYPYLEAKYSALMGSLYLELGELGYAKQYANQALRVARNFTDSRPIQEAYKTLQLVAEREADPQLAYRYLRDYTNVREKYLDVQRSNEVAFQLAKTQAANQAAQIALLDERNRVLQLQDSLSKKRMQLISVLAVMLSIILLAIVFWVVRLKKRQLDLQERADFDGLTGICNRRYLADLALSSIAHCQRIGQPISVIVLDLDLFKSINDNYGHTVGDWVLQQTAKQCTANSRAADIVGRLGGEEFAIVLPGANAEAAQEIAEAIRAALQAVGTEETGFEFTFTASFGVSDSGRSDYDFKRLVTDADHAMYSAKTSGRNACVVFDMQTTFRPAHGSTGEFQAVP